MILRPYQQQLVNEIHQSWRQHQNVIAVMATGSGKTVCISDIVANHNEPSRIIAHRQELVSQISLALARNNVKHSLIAPINVIRAIVKLHMHEVGASFYRPNSQCAIAGVDTLVRRGDPDADKVGLWVIDECFPAGTLVDGRPIECILPGDYVTAFNETTDKLEKRKVNHIFRNPAPEHMVHIQAGHYVLHCTSNHPILTKRGWINAGEITGKDFLYVVRDSDYGNKKRSGVQMEENRTSILQQKMLKRVPKKNIIGNDVTDKQKICFRTNEEEQSNEEPGNKGKNEQNTKINRSRAESKGWKRKTCNRSGNNVIQNFQPSRVRVANNCHNWSFRRRLPNSLQNRLWQRKTKNRNRSRWCKSSFTNETKTRQEKRRVLEWVRVENVSVYKRSDIKQHKRNCGDGYVYNIEVDGLHTYIADNIVVHNCHHTQIDPLNKWGKAVQLYPNAKGLGVTATPMRSDGNGLGRHNNGPFDVMVQGPSMRWLIDSGYLTDYKIYVPPNDVDLSNATISSTTGDYTKPSVKKALRKSHIVGDIVQHYLRIAPGKLGVTFCSDVEMSDTVAEAYRQAGIPALSLSAKTPDAERWDALRRFRNREILQLVNCALFDEGFDLPAIEVVSMARPTASYGLYVQTFGRGLRLMEGKQQAIIIDHVGNVLRHGLPDARQDWTLDAKGRRGRSTVDDAIPLRSCMECFGVYERIYTTCPYCGHVHQPAGRGSPEQVDGSLIELDHATLARMRGEIERIDGSPTIPYGASPVVAASVKKRHTERQEAQAALRQTIAQWGGWRKYEGMTVDQTQRLFFFRFGIDVMTAQTLGKGDADKLRERIRNDLSAMG